MRLEVADPLIEQTVPLAVDGRGARAAYDRQREEVYAVADGEARDLAFRTLHRRWFVELNLAAPLDDALAEVPEVAAGVGRCSVLGAARPAEEGAELYLAPADPSGEGPDADSPSRRVLLIRLLPATLAAGDRLLPLARRELLHVADMLDPAFGYRPRLPPSPAGPVHDEVLRGRYGALWSTTVLGRLAHRHQAPPGAEAAARRRFAAAFPMLGKAAGEELFRRLFFGARPGHAELVDLAREPGRGLAPSTGAGRGGCCALCGFPSGRREPGLEPEVVAYLRQAKPRWRPAEGLCPRCADLYRARAGVFARTSAARRGAPAHPHDQS